MKPLRRVHGGNLREASEKYRVREDRFLDFSSNINPAGLPRSARRIIAGSLKKIKSYPDPESSSLKKTISLCAGLNEENILVGNGSIQLIYLAVAALKPARALIPVPAFTEYRAACELYGVKYGLIESGRADFRHDTGSIARQVSENDMLFLCNPNNPTGTLLEKKELERLLAECAGKNAVVVLDEAFIDFTGSPGDNTMMDKVRDFPNLVILRSFTKFFAIPGLRIGYLAADRGIVERIGRFRYPWSVNRIAQDVTERFLGDRGYMRRSRRYVLAQRERMYEDLGGIKGIHVFKPEANYLFFRIDSEKMDSARMRDLLGKKRILIRDCSDFDGLDKRYARVAVKRRSENRKLAAEIRKIMEKSGE
ncbi:MAG: threonine-phosphate decarboxylase [Elusimicrobia bacterium]|nr:threonine-phosphate decarboxylase [Elusimicrobiota bacterium]